jgi:ankyrin repeat protein
MSTDFENLYDAIKLNDIQTAKDILERNNFTQDEINEIFYVSYSYDTILLLLDRGADVNIAITNGWNKLMNVCRSLIEDYDKNIEIVKLLLDRGTNINFQNNNGTTSLMLAAGESNHDSSLECVKLLLDRGADVNIQNTEGKTALIYSAKLSNKESSLETVNLLLERGADPFILDNFGKSAFDYCPTRECKDLLAKYIWKRLYARDMDTAKRYGRSVLSKDVWEMVLLNKRQQQLCSRLSSTKNKEVLKYFALELNIPVTEYMTKANLCGLISRYLAYGKYYSEKGKKYTQEKVKKDINNIKDIASRFGLDRNRPVDEILRELALILEKGFNP